MRPRRSLPMHPLVNLQRDGFVSGVRMVKIGFMVLENFRAINVSLCSFELVLFCVLFCVLLENKFSFRINFKIELRLLMK